MWLDFCCIPQKEADGDEVPNGGRSEAEQQTFALMLRNVKILYLGLSVLILVRIGAGVGLNGGSCCSATYFTGPRHSRREATACFTRPHRQLARSRPPSR